MNLDNLDLYLDLSKQWFCYNSNFFNMYKDGWDIIKVKYKEVDSKILIFEGLKNATSSFSLY